MVLLLSMNEADCLDQQHRRSSATTNRHLTGLSAYRASGLVRRPLTDIDLLELLAAKPTLRSFFGDASNHLSPE